jgi:DNA-binding transcriptional regulator LsrR (DeoR family)
MLDEINKDSRVGLALKAAQLYYMQDLTMDAIGDELKVSRSSVSRLLQMAKDRGIIEFKLHPPEDGPTTIDRLDRVALSAARMLTNFFYSGMTMGVAWGSTTAAVSRNLVPRPLRGSRVVQLNGAGNTFTTGVTFSGEILRRFGEAYGSNVEQFPVPAFFDNPAAKEMLWKERSTKRILDIQARMDVALFGLGASNSEVPSQVYTAGYLSPADLKALDGEGIVGDIATVFYRADGSSNDIDINKRSTGPGLDVIRSVPRRICVIAGVNRLPSLRGAMAGKYISDLIIDDGTAQALLDDE